jgi:acyl-CoA hydrolase
VNERAEALIAVADPQFRDSLRAAHADSLRAARKR